MQLSLDQLDIRRFKDCVRIRIRKGYARDARRECSYVEDVISPNDSPDLTFKLSKSTNLPAYAPQNSSGVRISQSAHLYSANAGPTCRKVLLERKLKTLSITSASNAIAPLNALGILQGARTNTADQGAGEKFIEDLLCGKTRVQHRSEVSQKWKLNPATTRRLVIK